MYKVLSKNLIKILLISIILIIGCTQKKNHLGIPNNNLILKEKIINWEHFENYYSYEDSIRNSNTSILLVGNYNDNKAYSLLHYSYFPDSVSYLSNVNLKFKINEKYNFEECSNLKLGKINSISWSEGKTTWLKPSDTEDWSNSSGFSNNDFEDIPTENNLEGDTLNINLPDSIINKWIETDSTNYGFVLYSEQENSFLEINANDEKPVLTFDYKISEEDTMMTYSRKTDKETFIYNKAESTEKELQLFNDQLKLSDIYPTKIFMKFNISDSLFINDEDSGIENNFEYQRMKINKAELILHKENDNPYPLSGFITIKPYLVINDSVDSINPNFPFIYNEDYYFDGIVSTDSLNSDVFSIDVTTIVQDITSGTYTHNGNIEENYNKGILLKSITEHFDFMHISFAAKDNSDESLRPKLKIIYTLPIIEE